MLKKFGISSFIRTTFKVLFITFCLTFIPQDYKPIGGSGNGNGIYDDVGDSFSEFIVRNSVMNNIAGYENVGYLPILVRGHVTGDLLFKFDGSKLYFSHLISQNIPFTVLGKLLSINTDSKFHIYFRLLRLFSVFSLAFLTFYVCDGVLKRLDVKGLSLLPFGLASITGFAIFGQNLYHLIFLFWILPAAVVFLNKRFISGKIHCMVIFFLSALVFSRGYEFATTYTIITSFFAYLMLDANRKDKIKYSMAVFSSCCFGFALSLSIHALLIHIQTEKEIIDSYALILSSTKLRLFSASYVQPVLSSDFYYHLANVWSEVIIRIDAVHIAVTKYQVIMLLSFYSLLCDRKTRSVQLMLFIVPFIGYISWYVFAYQHIMYHYFFDLIIFSQSLGVFFIISTAYWLNNNVLVLKNMSRKLASY